MTHYEERFEEALSAIRHRVASVAGEIELGLESAIQAILTKDRQVANRVILGDKPINREIRAIDRMCHDLMASHLPTDGHQRFVAAVLRLDVELERIGDYAVAIAREAVQLSTIPSGSVSGDIQLMADRAQRMLRRALVSFNDQDAELARGTKGMASQIESTYQKVFNDLLKEGEKGTRPIKDLFALLVVFNRLGRVSDQAKNICEDTLFAVAGETKGEKVYRILFVDERNDAISQLAVACARKAFPESGWYSSVGWRPADRLLPDLEDFMQSKGLDGEGLVPRELGYSTDELADFHVIVALGQGAASQIEEIPFHTVLLEWEIGPVPNDIEGERATAWLDRAAQELQAHLEELMGLLRGVEAS